MAAAEGDAEGGAARRAAGVGARATECSTPALLLDVSAFERNCALLAGRVRAVAGTEAAVAVRAHGKAHKAAACVTAQLAALSEAGCEVAGVCAQTVSEAEEFAKAGSEEHPIDMLVSNQTVGAGKIARLAALAADPRVTLSACFDDAENAAAVGAAVASAGGECAAVVEVDVGQHRCGVADAQQAAELAERLAMGDMPGLSFKGLQCYHGVIQHVRALEDRRVAAEEAHAKAKAAIDAVRARGIRCDYITGGGSGTFEFELASGLYTELQPGSYFFMDLDYGANEWPAATGGDDADEAAAALSARPEQAMWVLSTVISAQGANDWVVVDAGAKAVNTDCGPPAVCRAPAARPAGAGAEEESGGGLCYQCAGDEHGIVSLAERAAGQLPKLGDKLWLAPSHVDPTTNAHGNWIVYRDGDVCAVWPVGARGPGL